MPRKSSVPSYRLHKASGQARTIVNGRHVYLGKYGSPESRQQYARILAEAALPAGVPTAQVTSDTPRLLVSELLVAYLKFAESYYSYDGQPTKEFRGMASLLTPLASEAFEGSVGPVFFFDANVRGSGKSRLTNIVSIIVAGHVAAKTSATENEEETRKRITSMVMDGTRMVFLDNLTCLGGPVMDAAITGEIWRDRGLGGNTLIERSLRMTWYATGNNVQLLGDMPRRVCFIRLESPLEMPELRTGFRHPNLLQHVRQHRAGLLTAALTLLRGYIAAGRPNQELPPWGSFEEWSDLVRSTIVWCGLADPAPPQAACSSTIDEEAQSQQCFLAALRHADFNGTGLRTSQMLEICSSR